MAKLTFDEQQKLSEIMRHGEKAARIARQLRKCGFNHKKTDITNLKYSIYLQKWAVEELEFIGNDD